MSNEKLGQEPAFPNTPITQPDGETILGSTCFGGLSSGMSKRYLTAKDILCAMLSNIELLKSNAVVAKKRGKEEDSFLVFTAYSLADELLEQENE